MTKIGPGLKVCAFATLLALAGARGASADTITFEMLPGGATPSDGQTIQSQFAALFGVSFALIGGGYPVIARVGAPATAFNTLDGLSNAATQGVGNYFLTDDGCVAESAPGVPCNPPLGLIIYYGAAVTAASGQLIDLDGTYVDSEQWAVEAFDSYNLMDGTLLGGAIASQTLNGASTNAGDGLVTPWAFSGIGDIWAIQLRWTGTNALAGFAFDNFSPPDTSSFFSCGADNICGSEDDGPPQLDQLNDLSSTAPVPVPEPSTVVTALIGLGFLAYRRRRAARS